MPGFSYSFLTNIVCWRIYVYLFRLSFVPSDLGQHSDTIKYVSRGTRLEKHHNFITSYKSLIYFSDCVRKGKCYFILQPARLQCLPNSHVHPKLSGAMDTLSLFHVAFCYVSGYFIILAWAMHFIPTS